MLLAGEQDDNKKTQLVAEFRTSKRRRSRRRPDQAARTQLAENKHRYNLVVIASRFKIPGVCVCVYG